MIRILLNGALGKMGRMVTEMVATEDGMEIVAGVDSFAAGASTSFPLFEALAGGLPDADVLVDFSRPDALGGILTYCGDNGLAAVLATTGYTDSDLATIRDAARSMPVFRSANMSIGINLLMDLTREAAAVLKGFDIEIVEMHHNTKVDSPSGTALMLADGINETLMNRREYVFGRHTKTERRRPEEIGIHSVRGGSIAGEHQVLFLGQDEVVSLTHTAASRRIFALGALRAVGFIAGREAGLYSMGDLLSKQYSVTSLAADDSQAMLTAWDVPARPKAIAEIFGTLGEAGILVDMISQTAPRGGVQDVSFTLPRADADRARAILSQYGPEAGEPVVKLTIAGQGMERQSGVAARVLDRLADADVGPLMITTSETRIGLLVAEKEKDRAIAALRAVLED